MISELYYKALAPLIEFRGGKPYWLVKRRRINSGDLAGYLDHGYRSISFTVDGDERRLRAHRLNYYMVHGYLPEMIDHIDRNPDNNDIGNLRECTNSQNQMNTAKKSGGSSKYKGVHLYARDNIWKSAIRAHGKTINLGRFRNEVDAAKSYNVAAIKYFGEFAVLNII